MRIKIINTGAGAEKLDRYDAMEWLRDLGQEKRNEEVPEIKKLYCTHEKYVSYFTENTD